ncbi:NAD(P)H-dependent D-xylose reductase [Nosema bombycis CQ1]|uniref:NAD(P)H-dependent D-xylose reductase n=1 Tax=Nosema bombycis (strain CQ1 / CVCC 102059) TaxID=578461 RepID=R0MHE7_NOSB1|nr:NAD(P)H-dependent D-xylose reductase [Nosema bombycis CQ1]|eukprot:EOB13570.1 NAD(P)H-dependent D-xylose reductase [Nosema bombycis CQ1]
MLEKKVKLNSGYYMPMIGLGTWQADDEQVLEKSIRYAIKVGYRHIDTAHIYGNEKVIGRTLKKIFDEGLIKREDLFITSKMFNNFHHCPEKAIRISLDDLQLDYLDLYVNSLACDF